MRQSAYSTGVMSGGDRWLSPDVFGHHGLVTLRMVGCPGGHGSLGRPSLVVATSPVGQVVFSSVCSARRGSIPSVSLGLAGTTKQSGRDDRQP